MGKLADWLGATSAIGQLVDQWLKTPLRNLLQRLARPTPLYLLGGPLALLMATVSSVRIRAEGSEERSAITLVSLDDEGRSRPLADTLGRDASVVRFFPLLTGPFGRPYQVDADGYLPAQLTVFPLVGREVLVGRDLALAPSVLFRPFVEGVAALRDGGVFTVTRLRGDSREQLASASDSGSTAAFMVGRRKPVPDAMSTFWALELTALGAPEEVKAVLLLAWRNPRQLAVQAELSPRDCLLAEIRLDGQPKARALVTLQDSPLADVLLSDVVADTVGVPTC